MRKKIPASLAVVLLLLTAAQAARKPRNPRRFKKPRPVSSAVALSTAAAQAVAARQIPRLAPGRWDPAVKDALENFIAERSSASAGYDLQRPPVAVIGWDQVAVEEDAGTVVFRRLVERVDFKFDDEFWELIPLVYGRQRLRAAYGIFSILPVSIWESQPEYHQYRKGFLSAYEDMCVKSGRAECRAWLSRLLKGFSEKELMRYAREAFGEKPLREVPEIKDLVGLLLRSGFDVWIIDCDNQTVLEAASQGYGVDVSRVIGVRLALDRGKFTTLQGLVPIRSGKVAAAATGIGRPPQIVVGAFLEDQELLRHGAGLKLVLDAGQSGLKDLARENGWLIQGAWAAGSPGLP